MTFSNSSTVQVVTHIEMRQKSLVNQEQRMKIMNALAILPEAFAVDGLWLPLCAAMQL